MCDGVGAEHFYACLWDCLASNSGIRLPAISFVLAHFNKKLSMEEQKYIMGTNTTIMVSKILYSNICIFSSTKYCLIFCFFSPRKVSALCAGVQDTSVLVQRSALDFLLIGFPIHNSQLTHQNMILLIKAALVTILRRDMSLNR